MSKTKFKYYLNPSISGDLHTQPPPYERKDKGKFILNSDLSQQDLEYLFETGTMDGKITQAEVLPETIKTRKR